MLEGHDQWNCLTQKSHPSPWPAEHRQTKEHTWPTAVLPPGPELRALWAGLDVDWNRLCPCTYLTEVLCREQVWCLQRVLSPEVPVAVSGHAESPRGAAPTLALLALKQHSRKGQGCVPEGL